MNAETRSSNTTANPAFRSNGFDHGWYKDVRFWLLMGSLAVIHGLFLSLKPLWLDEAYSSLMARRTFGEINRILTNDAGPPLYYYLLRLWRGVAGESEFALRLLSLLCALAACAGLFALASRIQSKQLGWIAVVFYGTAPITSAYIHEARNYTLLAALSVWFCYAYFSFLFYSGRKSTTGIIVLGALLVYTHHIGWFLPLAGLLSALLFVKDKRLAGRLAIGYGAIAVLYVPWIPVLFAQMNHTELTIGWIRRLWTPWVIGVTFSSYIPGGATFGYLDLPVFPWWAQTLVGLAYCVPFLYAFVGRHYSLPRVPLLLLSLCGFTLIGPYMVSLVLKPMYLPGRTDYIVFPYWCLLIAFGVTHIPSLWLRRSLVIGLVALSSMVSFAWMVREEGMSERSVVLYLQNSGDEGDVIVCTGLSRPPLEYYLAPHGFDFLSYPRDMRNHLAHFNEEWYVEHLDLEQDAERLIVDLHAFKEKPIQIWIVGTDDAVSRHLLRAIENDETLMLSEPIHTPKMGLRKLGMPLLIWRVYFKS